MSARDEITLAAQPASVSAARRFVRTLLEEEAGRVAEDAVLVVSELVANAVLHAGGPVSVAVTYDEAPPGRVRLEVGDGSPVLPSVRSYGAGASTGRGLALVAMLASRWGVERAAGSGKIVWAELVGADAGADADRPPMSTGGSAAPTPPAAARHRVRFLGVPVGLYLELQEQNDAVLRELELLAFTADHHGELDPSPELVDVIERSRRFFNVAREGFRREVMAAAERGVELVDLTGWSDPATIVPSADFVGLFEQAEDLAARGELLIGAAPAPVRHLRRWFVAEMSRQLLEGEPPARFARPPEDPAR